MCLGTALLRNRVRPGRKAATVLATSVGAAAVATTALAGPAEAAANHTVWDRVAHCESGNRWHINTGNGYYGGLQFSRAPGRAYGGNKYASRADHASRAEQIQVARRVLKRQGAGAWPVCGPRAGLSKSSGHATSARLPANAGNGMTSGSAPKSTHKKSTHKKVDAQEVDAQEGDAPRRRAARPRAHLRRAQRRHAEPIAQRFHVHGGWHALYRANRSHLHNPNVLRVGQHLRHPVSRTRIVPRPGPGPLRRPGPSSCPDAAR